MVFKVALTGGIGSGKSTVTSIFAKLGAEIIDADQIAYELTQIGQPGYLRIVEQFGQTILDNQQQIDRSQLRKLIFSNSQQKKQLEEILHPMIMEAIRERLRKVRTSYCIIVIPLLVETSLNFNFIDRICLVDAPITLRKQWAAKRDRIPEDQIEKVIANQASSTERLTIAEDVIINDQDMEALELKVKKLHQQYLQMAAT